MGRGNKPDGMLRVNPHYKSQLNLNFLLSTFRRKDLKAH